MIEREIINTCDQQVRDGGDRVVICEHLAGSPDSAIFAAAFPFTATRRHPQHPAELRV